MSTTPHTAKPEGRLSVDRLLYLPPASKEPVLNGVSFDLEPGSRLPLSAQLARGNLHSHASSSAVFIQRQAK